MSGIAGTKSSLTWAVHISLVAMVLLWLFPTVGLLVSSFRTADQISTSGWWSSLSSSEQNQVLRTAAPETQIEKDGVFVIEGNLFEEESESIISVWGTRSNNIDAYAAGDTATLNNGATLTVSPSGDYLMQSDVEMEGRRGARVFVTAETPP